MTDVGLDFVNQSKVWWMWDARIKWRTLGISWSRTRRRNIQSNLQGPSLDMQLNAEMHCNAEVNREVLANLSNPRPLPQPCRSAVTRCYKGMTRTGYTLIYSARLLQAICKTKRLADILQICATWQAAIRWSWFRWLGSFPNHWSILSVLQFPWALDDRQLSSPGYACGIHTEISNLRQTELQAISWHKSM